MISLTPEQLVITVCCQRATVVTSEALVSRHADIVACNGPGTSPEEIAEIIRRVIRGSLTTRPDAFKKVIQPEVCQFGIAKIPDASTTSPK